MSLFIHELIVARSESEHQWSFPPAMRNVRMLIPMQVVCVIGVSGVGKTTVVERAIALHPELYRTPVSATTRPKRAGETDGIDYHFLDQATFDAWDAQGLLAESASYNGCSYGTPLSELDTDQVALHVVEDAGAQSLRERVGAAVVAIVPPSDETRVQRLEDRGDGAESVAQRLLADAERDQIVRSIADEVIVNDDLDDAARALHESVQRLLKP
jgi:guanylate kinase